MKRHLCLAFIGLLFVAACSSPEPKKEPAPAPAPAVAEPTKAVPAPKQEAPKLTATKKTAPAAVAQTPPPPPAPTPAPSQPVVPAPQPQPREPQVVAVPQPVPAPPPPPEPKKVTLPPGTMINIRMIDSIDAGQDHVGQSFHASMDEALKVNGETVIPKGADVYVKLVDVKAAGNMTGTSQLKVQLDRLFVGKKSYTIESNVYTQTGQSQTAKTAKTVGIGTAIGAAIGAIAGGKKGAAIGASAGAGGGAAVEAATKGEQVKIASEAPLTFRLEAPVEVTISADAQTQPAGNRLVPNKP